MYRTALACGLFALLAAPAAGADKPRPEEAVAALEEAMQEAIKRAEPAVVCILVSRSDAYKQVGAMAPADSPGRLGGFDGPRLRKEAKDRHDLTREALVNRLDLAAADHVPESYGSGIVIDEAGLVLTNYHVVREATKVFVRLPGGKGSYADVHAADPRSDLAVLKLLTPPAGLKALPLGRGEAARKGQFVLALTNAFASGFRDNGPSASWGIVSNLRYKLPPPAVQDRGKTTLYHFGTLIQTDAKLNKGCSGGALLNLKGELIGITSSLAAVESSDEPAGFAVPMTEPMHRIIKRLKEGKEVEYGFLGVTFNEEADPDGVRIRDITTGSPAAEERIPANHYLVKVDGTPIRTNDDVFLTIGTALAGSKIKLELAAVPNGPTREYTVELAKYYVPGPFIASERPPAVGGLRVDYTSTLIRTNNNSQRIPRGVVVREVLRNSAAEKANVQVDRIITKVNGRAVATPAEYYEEVRKGTGPLELTLSSSVNGEETVKLDRR